MNEAQTTWVEMLETFLEGYGLPTAIASAVALIVIVAIPTLVQVLRLVSASKQNAVYKVLTLKRVASSAMYSKKVAEASKNVVAIVSNLLTDLSNCKRIADVKAVSADYENKIVAEGKKMETLVQEGDTLANEFGSVPTNKAMKEMAKEKSK